MNASHTPGPWHVNELNVAQKVDPYYIFIEPGVAVIERKVEGKNQHDMADARLIAAAPAMLEALEGFANIGEYRELREAMANCLRPHERAGFLAGFEKAIAAVRAAKGE